MPRNAKPELSPNAVEVSSLGERPRPSALFLSACVHGIAVSLILLWYTAGPKIISPPQFQVVQVIRGRSGVSFRRSLTSARNPAPHRSKLPIASAAKEPASPNSSGDALQGEAKRQTAAIMNSLKFRQIYGFYPGHDYQLPIRKSGEIPRISPEQLPPNYAQFVVVDITIDTQGAVSDAQIVAGLVEPPIQQILLSAVRQFKYIPAKRDNVPIPSQLEIVIPVPG